MIGWKMKLNKPRCLLACLLACSHLIVPYSIQPMLWCSMGTSWGIR